jgi:hypothetical protein
LFIIGFVWANFCLYRKYAVPRLATEVVGESVAGTVTSDNWKGVHPSIRTKIRVVNNSDKSCSIVKICVHSEGEWDWVIDRVYVERPVPGETCLPYSIPAHDACQFEVTAVLRTAYFDAEDIHFNRLKLEIQDQTKKTYSH